MSEQSEAPAVEPAEPPPAKVNGREPGHGPKQCETCHGLVLVVDSSDGFSMMAEPFEQMARRTAALAQRAADLQLRAFSLIQTRQHLEARHATTTAVSMARANMQQAAQGMLAALLSEIPPNVVQQICNSIWAQQQVPPGVGRRG